MRGFHNMLRLQEGGASGHPPTHENNVWTPNAEEKFNSKNWSYIQS